jgi:hypothetical protein
MTKFTCYNIVCFRIELWLFQQIAICFIPQELLRLEIAYLSLKNFEVGEFSMMTLLIFAALKES